MKKLKWVFLTVILLLTACANKTADNYTSINLDEVKQLQDDGAIVLDVREVEEFADGHIIDAINVPLSELKQDYRADLNKKETYIVICRSGNRSIEASDILFEDGYDVVNVSEGMSSWMGEVE